MGHKRAPVSAKALLPFKSANKDRRKRFHKEQKQAKDSIKRTERFRRRKEEEKNPRLKAERLQKNKPHTLDSKRQWDDVVGADGDDMLGLAVDMSQLSKKRKVEKDPEPPVDDEVTGFDGFDNSSDDESVDSMLIDDDDEGQDDEDQNNQKDQHQSEADQTRDKPSSPRIDQDEHEDNDEHHKKLDRTQSLTSSVTSTRPDIAPETLINKFSSIFNPPQTPKVLITTSINSMLHNEAEILTTLFPNSAYVRRTANRFGHKYSIREISSFASNRNFTTLVVLMEEKKKPTGLDVVHLPSGPMFHFSISNWVEGKKLPDHGNSSGYYPELVVLNFKTPLGMLVASLFRTMFPRSPELQGREVVTLQNQRDYIFVRRHRYVFREKRSSEKTVTDTDGKPVKGVEDIRAGLQELGPRFTLKLRRVDCGIQRSSGQEWQWKGKTDKTRTRFQL